MINKQIINLLKRVKKSFEPMPIVGDLKAFKKTLAEARISPKEKKITKKVMKQNERKNRKLYADICNTITNLRGF